MTSSLKLIPTDSRDRNVPLYYAASADVTVSEMNC